MTLNHGHQDRPHIRSHGHRVNGFSCNLQRFFGAKQKVAERLARFRQVNLEQASMHHDALEFSNGKIILLARLCEGHHAIVLQLPASRRATNEAERQKRGSLVA